MLYTQCENSTLSIIPAVFWRLLKTFIHMNKVYITGTISDTKDSCRIWTHSHSNSIGGHYNLLLETLAEGSWQDNQKQNISHQASSNADGKSISMFSGEYFNQLPARNSSGFPLFLARTGGILNEQIHYGLQLISVTGYFLSIRKKP